MKNIKHLLIYTLILTVIYQPNIFADNTKAEEFNEKGNYYFKQRNYESAIPHYEAAIESEPANHIYYTNLAYALFLNSQFARAEEYADKAISLSILDDKAFYIKGVIISDIYKEPLNSIYYYLKAIDINNMPYYHSALADAYFLTGDVKNAQLYVNKALGYGDTSDITYKVLGNVHYAQGLYNKALDYYKKSLDITKSSIVFVNLGKTETKLGDFNSAINSFYEAISLNSSSYEAYFGLGKAYFLKKNYADSIDMFRKAVNINNSYAEAYHNLGVAYLTIKNKSQAKYYFKKACELDFTESCKYK